MNDQSNSYAAVVLTGRDLRLDLFRGLALWLIFLDHIPSNVVSWITLRNYGFSDATEIFVFISGYTAAFVYGRAMRERGFVVASARVLRRVWQIYVAHVFLFVIYMAEIAYVSARFANPLYKEEMGVFEFLNRPDVTLVEALLLKFKPVNMDVLPLYIVLLFGLPPLLWLLLRRPALALASSVALYVLNWYFDLNFPAYPSGDWAFNPLAWQLLFVCGAWCALGGAKRYGRVFGSPVTVLTSAVYLILSFVVTLTWWVPALVPLVPKWLGDFIYPIDKANLDMLRFWHFVALAIVTVRFVPRDWPVLRSRLLEPVILCGQHSLEIFCLGVFLAFAGHFIFNELSDRVLMQVLVSMAGIAIMTGVAGLISWYKTLDSRGPGSRSRPPDADLAGGEA
ncbi:MAG: OpgC domain-containing protein [Xanthobacteraceae bacterium]|jgi:hypothetical protein